MYTQSLTRTFWSYTLPAMAALMVGGLYTIVDGIFIGRAMGADGLSSLNLAWPLAGVVWAVSTLVGMGGGAELSIARGAEAPRRVGVTLAATTVLTIVLSLLSGALILGFGPLFLAFQGADGALMDHGLDYLRVKGWTAPVLLAGMVMPLILRNLGAPRFATAALLLGAVLNVALDWLLVIAFDMGLAGAAYATVIAEAVVILFSLGAMVRLDSFALFVRPTAHELRAAAHRILGTGFASMLMALYISFVVVLHNVLFLRYGGPMTLAAYTVAGYVVSLVYYLTEGVAGGLQPLASYFHGARDRMKIAQVLRLALLVGVGGTAALTALVVGFPMTVARVFAGADAALVAETAHGLRLHLWAMFLDGFIILSATWFQSVGRARTATAITLANMGVQLPFLFVLPKLMGVAGVWLAMPLSNVALSLAVVWLLWRANRGVLARAAVLARRALEEREPAWQV